MLMRQLSLVERFFTTAILQKSMVNKKIKKVKTKKKTCVKISLFVEVEIYSFEISSSLLIIYEG